MRNLIEKRTMAPMSDFWQSTEFLSLASEDQQVMRLRESRPITPLDIQFGIHPTKTVPEDLLEPLFGADDTSSDAQSTFAVLDAARIPLLKERMEQDALEFECLFTGDARSELEDVAPYLVQLTPEATLTRDLLTQSDAHYHYWGQRPGMFLRSRLELDQLHRHFRKFTRLQDDIGKWYYVRFWEGTTFLTLAREGDAADRARMFAHPIDIYAMKAVGAHIVLQHGGVIAQDFQ